MRRSDFLTDVRGMGAVEFAILSPILILVIFGVIVGAAYATQLLDTRAAVQAGAKYVLQGGSNTTTIRTVALSAWANKPDGASIVVRRYCTCGITSSNCAVLCVSTQKPPSAYIEIKASAAWSSPILYNHWFKSGAALTQEQVVRVR